MNVPSRPRVPCSCTRGFLRPNAGDQWIEACVICNGKGTLGVTRLSRLLGEHPSTLRRFLQGKRMARRTLVRFVEVLTRLDTGIRDGKDPRVTGRRTARQGELFG